MDVAARTFSSSVFEVLVSISSTDPAVETLQSFWSWSRLAMSFSSRHSFPATPVSRLLGTEINWDSFLSCDDVSTSFSSTTDGGDDGVVVVLFPSLPLRSSQSSSSPSIIWLSVKGTWSVTDILNSLLPRRGWHV